MSSSGSRGSMGFDQAEGWIGPSFYNYFIQERKGLKMRTKTFMTTMVVLVLALIFARNAFSTGVPTANASAYSGYSFACVIPYVTSANNTRTNLGINNLSTATLARGNNPSTQVLLELFDTQGNLKNSASYTVNGNQMSQINKIIESFNLGQDTGWVRLWSTEPFTAWASVIYNDSNDSAIELGVPFNPILEMDGTAFSTASRLGQLLIASSVKTAAWQSSLVVTNVSWNTGGDFKIRFYDNLGQLILTDTQTIPANGMYINDDIRNAVNGTYGPIIIEPQTPGLMLTACSIVKYTGANYSSFFTAQTIPPNDTLNVAGVWQGAIATEDYGILNYTFTLFQNKTIISGTAITSNGPNPNVPYTILGTIRGGLLLMGMYQPPTGSITKVQVAAFAQAQFNNGSMQGYFLGGSTTGLAAATSFSATRTGSSFANFP
jgi:hypothetical protein